MKKFNLKDVKYMHYLDYKLNNTPKFMKRYEGKSYPRLVKYLVNHEDDDHTLNKVQAKKEAKRIYKTLFVKGLFHSCQA